MSKPIQFLLLLVVVAAVAVGSCLLTRCVVPMMMHRSLPEDASIGLYRQIGITKEQEKALAPIERRFTGQRAQLTQAIKQANAELAAVIEEDKAVSPRVNAAIEKIHAAQGALQMAAIAHVFEMKAVLTPEQGARLLRLSAVALRSENAAGH